MDTILTLGWTFSLLLFVIGVAISVYCVWLALKYLAYHKQGHNHLTCIKQFGGLLLIAAILLGSYIRFLMIEVIYRPKNQLNTTPVIETVPRDVSMPELPEAEGDKKDNANANYSEENRAENRESVEAFKALPNE